jgi:hypothetical protein
VATVVQNHHPAAGVILHVLNMVTAVLIINKFANKQQKSTPNKQPSYLKGAKYN